MDRPEMAIMDEKQVFRFKRFAVRHRDTPMKVGTDGVLAGAWTRVTDKDRWVLDVGTGCGLIALMIAQRSGSGTEVHGIDIERAAAREAAYNMAASPWAGRCAAFHASLQEYARTCATKYDLLVSNPPFFSESLKPPSPGRSLARHDDSLPAGELFSAASLLLAPGGKASVIVPAGSFEKTTQAARRCGFHLRRMLRVRGTPEKPVKRILAEYSAEPGICDDEGVLVIESDGRHGYSDAYRRMTEPFYLRF